MTASAFTVVLPVETAAKNLVNGVDALVVFAHDSTDAKAIAKAMFGGDANAAWAGATVTAIAAAADFEGWRLRVRVSATQHGVASAFDHTSVGLAGAAVADIAALMVTALNATHIDGAAFAGSTLKIAETTDGVGDSTVAVFFYPPLAQCKRDVSITDFITNLVHEGVAGAALTVDLNTSFIAPSIVGFRLGK